MARKIHIARKRSRKPRALNVEMSLSFGEVQHGGSSTCFSGSVSTPMFGVAVVLLSSFSCLTVELSGDMGLLVDAIVYFLDSP